MALASKPLDPRWNVSLPWSDLPGHIAASTVPAPKTQAAIDINLANRLAAVRAGCLDLIADAVSVAGVKVAPGSGR
jgi:hypothetical protein